jgi:hypothetical protein
VVRAPSNFLGDWSYIFEVRFDHRILDIGDGYDTLPYSISIGNAAGDTATWFGSPPSLENGPWTSIIVALVEEEWVVVGVWEDLIANVEYFLINIGLVANSGRCDKSGLDNVRLIADPGAAISPQDNEGCLARPMESFPNPFRPLPAGSHTVLWDASDGQGRRVTPGLYLYCLEVGGSRHVAKTIVLR